MKKPERLGHPDFPLESCLAILRSNTSTEIKREAISSIGRKRNPDLKHLLYKLLQDKNPALVLQAIRGLLVFKDDPETLQQLKRLEEHPNEIIQDVIHVELKKSVSVLETNHVVSPEVMQNVVVEGDVLKILEDVPDSSVHLTFTSPPYYNARDYSIYQSYDAYLSFLERVFQEVHRVTKTGRFFILNTSPVIFPRPSRKYSSRRYSVPFDIHSKLVKMGWHFIDDLIWSKPIESSKNRVAGFEMNRKPLTYKANSRTEYVMVYRKGTHKLIDWNLKQYSPNIHEESKVDDDFERSNIWEIPPSTDKVHSAVFPLKLCDQIVKLYSFVGDLVFDPFAGSGTFGSAALAKKRRIFLTEVSAKYIARMKEKIGSNNLYDDLSVRYLNTKSFRMEMRKWQSECRRNS